MLFNNLSKKTQKGLFQWIKDNNLEDKLYLDIASYEEWAWIWFCLRESEDRPEWFPKGKWSVLQHIEDKKNEEARNFQKKQGE